jgi:hypothetical protein
MSTNIYAYTTKSYSDIIAVASDQHCAYILKMGSIMAVSHQEKLTPTMARKLVKIVSAFPKQWLSPTRCDDSRVTESGKKSQRRTYESAVSATFATSVVLSVVASATQAFAFESGAKLRTVADIQHSKETLENAGAWIIVTGLCKTLQSVESFIHGSCFTVIVFFMIALVKYDGKRFLSRFQLWMTYLTGRNIGSELGSILVNTAMGRDDLAGDVLAGVAWYALVGYLFFLWFRSDSEVKKYEEDGNEVQYRGCVCVGPTIC